MSRLIVKNLPNKVTESQFTDYFSKMGQITDARLMFKDTGMFRGFGYIGFESEEVADNALKEFHNTFFKQNKIIVEKCQHFNFDKNYKKDSKKNPHEAKANTSEKSDFKYAVKMKEAMTKEKLKTLMENPKFIQYLKLNQKGAADLVDTLKEKYKTIQLKEEEEKCEEEKEEEEKCEEEDEKSKAKEKKKLANRNISDLEYLKSLMTSTKENTEEKKETKERNWKQLFTVVVRTNEQLTNPDKKGKTFTKKGVKDFFKPLKCQSLRIPRRMTFVAYIGFNTEKELNQALMKDKSFLDGVRVRIRKYVNRDECDHTQDDRPWKLAEEKVNKEATPVGESGKLFVRNLWYSVTEEDLRALFEKIGPLSDLTLPLSKLSRKPKGFAHVSYMFPEHAVRAANEMDGMSFQGRVLHILPSLEDDENKDTEGKSFKEQKKDQLAKTASSWHNWNTLFMGSGAVIDLMADKLQQSKHQMFEGEGNGSTAVNLALGEAHFVDETKTFLEAGGVSLDAFSKPNVQRSATVMLAKNLPAHTKATELKELFERHGELGRVVLPPAGVTAIIEFLDSGEAKKAFKELAYSRFKYLPLYLEWAPIEVFSTPAPLIPAKEAMWKADEKAMSEIPEDNTTLYVKNLNFSTDEETLKTHFSQMGEIASVLIAKRRALSQGYGFVQFVKASDARKACKLLQNTPLDGHTLSLKMSEKKLTNPLVNSARQFHSKGEETSPKILVKNIPFQATYREISQLFAAFGEIKSVRLPKKAGSAEHRGFGFVEFLVKENAKRAIDALGLSTHLYGRRLVLEWAKEEESVEELRKRTAERYYASGPQNKRQKVDVSSDKKPEDEYT